MAVEFKWIILQLDVKPQEEGLQDVVTIVHWRRNAKDGVYTSESYGAMPCGTPNATDFTAYPDLTITQVESWLDSGVDVNLVDSNLVSDIEDQKNLPIVTLPLPWTLQP